MKNDPKTLVGNFATGKIDVGDLPAFDAAGPHGGTTAGALIHETVEQVEKAKDGLKPGDDSGTDFQKDHQTAIKAENAVNGNTRDPDGKPDQDATFAEQDGSDTVQTVTSNTDGSAHVLKTNAKIP